MPSNAVNRSKALAIACYLTALLALLPAHAAEEPGRVDPGFTAFASSTPQSVPSGLYVQAIAEQPDGKILFSGPFVITATSFSQRYFVRSFPNGNIDVNFRVTVNGPVSEIAVHADGSIIIAGAFSSVNGLPRGGIARLLDTGVVDVWFNPNSVPLYRVENVFRCANGTTVAKAWLTNSLGGIIKRVVRFNHQGTLDPAFDVTVEPSYYSYSWSTERNENLWRLVAATPRSWGNAPGADERFYIVGGFTSVNGIARTNIARVLPEGTVDASFAPSMIPFPDSLYSQSSTDLAVQPDGRVIVWDGTNTVRLNTDGSFDDTFNAGNGFVPGGGPVSIHPDGRILVQAAAPAGIPRSRLWRLNSDGTFDWSFHGGTGPTNTSANYIRDYTVVTPLTDGKIMVGGGFNGIDGSWRAIIARLYGGNLTPDVPRILEHPDSLALRELQPMTLSSDIISFEKPSIEWRKDGTRLPGGTNLSISVDSVSLSDAGEYTVVFSNSVGTVTSTVAHVTVDPRATGPGSLDIQYSSQATAEGYLYNITIDRDDRALVSSSSEPPLRRFNYDGSTDPSFNLGTIEGPDGAHSIYSVSLTASDEIYIGGYFDTIDGTDRIGIARLKPDGDFDTSFAANAGYSVLDSAYDSDGKLVIAGSFREVNGVPKSSLARLNPDGALDLTFNTANVFSNYPYARQIIRLPTGMYLLDATNRLNPDGSVDDSFYVGPVAGSIRTSIDLPSGDILIAGSFTNVSSLPRNLIARLRGLDGLVDASFSAPPLYCTTDDGIFDMTVQPDGKILIAGRFYIGTNNSVTYGVARLNANGTLDTNFSPVVVGGTREFYSYYRPFASKLAIQSDGGILVGGDFTLINGYPRTNLVRLNGDRVIAASAPTAQTGTATNITFLSATLCGLANPHDAATRVYFEYGTNTSYGNGTAFAKLPASTSDVAVTLDASNLLGDTTYHYRMVATNRTGVAFGEDREFTTTSRPAEPRISSPVRSSNGGIDFTFPGDPGRRYAVMVSTNLIEWTEAGTAMEINAGTFRFSEGQTGNPASKFYRLRTP